MEEEGGSVETSVSQNEVTTRPRSFSCVLLDSRPVDDSIDDDDDDEEEEEDEEESVVMMEDLSFSDEFKEPFDDDEVRKILEKKSDERNEQDMEVLLQSMKHMTAFNNTSQSVKEELCSVMRFICFKDYDWVVIEDGEELEDWFLIINGSVKVVRADGSIDILRVGQSFGVCANKDVVHQDGQVRTNECNCQFVRVLRKDFHSIFDEFEQNKINVEDEGRLVLVLERKVNEDNKDGYIVIQGSKEKLMSQLLDGGMVDPTYIEDFLLTYRVFIHSPMEVTDFLLKMFRDKTSREKVARVLLLWINNHFEDFEGNNQLLDFVGSFKGLLKIHKMFGHLKMLDIAHSAHSLPRQLTLSRPNKDDRVPFSLVCGMNKSAFVSRVENSPKLVALGLRRGDRLLELNGKRCSGLSMKEIMKVIKSSTHLSMKVKSDLYGFEEACASRDLQKNSKTVRDGSRLLTTRKVSVASDNKDEDNDDSSSFISSESDEYKETTKHSISNFCRTLFGLGCKHEFAVDPSDKLRKFGRKQSLALPPRLMIGSASSSDPDLSDLSGSHSLQNLSPLPLREGGMLRPPDAVIKVFRADHTFKYIPINKEFSCREVVVLMLKELSLNETADSYCLCEVTFAAGGLTRTRILAEDLCNLSSRLPLNARYFLKNKKSPIISIPDEVVASFLRETSFSFLELAPLELATQLALRAFKLLKAIRSSDHIFDLFNKESNSFSRDNVERFSQLSNEELFWVATEVCSATNLMRRVKTVKQFIKIAELCRTAQNYNSMFSILSGLRHGSVARLKNTWEKVPPKYIKMFEGLQEAMDPSRNMSKYRNMLGAKIPDIPIVPFFPVFKKDITFVHLGNNTEVNDLINFEKMRMLAKEVRCLNKLTKGSYMTAGDMFKPFKDLICNGTEGWMKRGLQFLPRRLYEEGLQSKKTQTYLENLKVIYNEAELDRLSQLNEASIRCVTLKKMFPQSSSTSNILSADESQSVLEGSPNSRELQSRKGMSQPFINKIVTSKRLKVKSVLKKGGSLSSASSSSSSKKHDFDEKMLTSTPTQRWSSSSDNPSTDAIESLSCHATERLADLTNVPPPTTLPIVLQHQGHPIIRPISHPPSRAQLAVKFPNFKPLPNSHQPYLNIQTESVSSTSSRSYKILLEPIYSPAGDDDDSGNLVKPTQVSNRTCFGKRSASSDHLLRDVGAGDGI